MFQAEMTSGRVVIMRTKVRSKLRECDWLSDAHPQGVGFCYLDHLTRNVFQGNMDKSDRGQIVPVSGAARGVASSILPIRTDDIYASVDAIATRGIEFMPGPNRIRRAASGGAA